MYLHAGVLQLFNAGHVDPVIKSKNGNMHFIKGPAIPLMGVSSRAVFTPMSLLLNAGDRFYLYSNDIVEAVNKNGETYGIERLRSIIASAGNNAEEIAKSIRQDVMDFAGDTPLEADIGVAVFEYTPVEE